MGKTEKKKEKTLIFNSKWRWVLLINAGLTITPAWYASQMPWTITV
tara:strand:- start:411 stop:548 length:138 start_codon:yes stop_codon:yes gene_type:complete